MPTPWLKRIRETKQLTVFNKAAAWSPQVAAAIRSFNSLGFGVTLVEQKENERAANIVVLLATGPTSYPYYGDKTKTDSEFTPDILHGQASTLVDKKRHEIFFATVFLPGKLKTSTSAQKEMVIVHEFIHAAGLNSNADHDSEGIMFGQMMEEKGGLIEYLHEKNARPMPAIRVGAMTMCKMKMLWAGGDTCDQ